MVWNIDSDNSEFGFAVKHLMVSTVKGRFRKVSGKVNWDEENSANSSVEATVEAASVQTNDKTRDKNLRSPEFFDVEKYPALTFKSKQIKEVGKYKYKFIGDLTIRDVTREVAFQVEYAGRASNPFERPVAGFIATTVINRKDFGLGWSAAKEAGGVLVGDNVKIELHVRAIKESAVIVAA